MGKSSPQAPATPDYTGAAVATAAGNKEAAQATADANRVNQVTPYGSLYYDQTGTSAAGNPTYTAYQFLSPDQQKLLDSTNSLNNGLMSTANTGLKYADNVLSKPGVSGWDIQKPQSFGQNINAPQSFGQNMSSPDSFGENIKTPSNFKEGNPTTGFNPGQSYQDAMMARLSPQIERDRAASDNQLANQGIMQGSEAYNNAKTLLAQQHNDLLGAVTTQGFNTGLAANNQAYGQNRNQYDAEMSANNQNFGQNQALFNSQAAINSQNYGQNQALYNSQLGANNQNFNQNQAQYGADLNATQQGFQQAAYNQMQPINLINSLRTGSQVQNPNFVNAPQQANVAGADLLGAAQGNYNAQMGQYNAQLGSNNAMTSGLMGLAGAGLGAGILKYSDIRLKTNINRIGTHPLGIGLYEWDYLWGEHAIGVMADEVEQVMPEAIHIHSNGYKMVDYGMINHG